MINVFVFSQYLDLITTIRGIGIFGTAVEGNPIVSNIFTTHGPLGFIIVKVIVSIVVIVMGYCLYQSRFKKHTIILFYLVSTAMIIVAIMNTTFLL